MQLGRLGLVYKKLQNRHRCKTENKYKPFKYLGSDGATTNHPLVFFDIYLQECLQILQVGHGDVSTVTMNTINYLRQSN